MIDITANWHWPQWAIVILLFTGFILKSARHGKEAPAHNGFAAIARIMLWTFILVSGGFFR